MKRKLAILAAAAITAHAAITSTAQSAPPASAPATNTAPAIVWKGDLRYRFESIRDESKLNADKEVYTRQRDRIRARLGAEAKRERLKAGIELSTGQSDPVSGNQSLGDGFGKKDFKLNLAYFDYTLFSDDAKEVSVIAGKMKNPFVTFPDDLVWDSDLTPEGIAMKSRIGDDTVSLQINAAYLWVQERSDKDDLMLYAAHAALRFQFTPVIALSVGGSLYGFQGIEGYDVLDWEGKNNAYGNSTINGSESGNQTNKAWASGFTPIVYFAQLETAIANKPLTLYAQMLNNGDASSDNEGHLIGVALGKAKAPASWELGYNLVELERDAVVGMLTDSDRWGGGTDGRGHKIYAKYQLAKNLQLGASLFINEKIISDSSKTKDYERLQLDVLCSF